MTSSFEWEKQREAEPAIRPMEYPVLRGMPGREGVFLPEEESPSAPELERGLQEEVFARELEAVRQEAFERGKQTAAGESSAWRQQRAAELTTATEAFRASRDNFLAMVEKEVVRLALAVAERILRRESQLDPLLLSGAVRKALGQVAESTEVRLRVPAEQQEMWAEVVRLMPGLPLRPEVVTNVELAPGAVMIESRLGTVDLSVSAQLEEIERAFFDRGETRGEEDRGLRTGAAREEGTR